jgi:regulator of protease activity HflC (stomatin/prohibitin superfamily)
MERTRKGFKAIIGIVLAIVLVLIVSTSALIIINEGTVGVKYRFGKIVATDLEPGVHFVLPFIETVKKVDVTEQIFVMDVSTYTRDTQTVDSLDIQVNYYYSKADLDTLIRSIGIKNVEPKLIMPNLTSVLKNEVGKYKAEELIANRSQLEMDIQQSLSDKLTSYGLIISRVAIQDIEFESAFEQVVEQKVAAEQKALTVQNETIQKQEEARQKVIAAQAEADAILVKAQAEAEANRLLNESLTGELLNYYKIQAWNGEFPQVMGNEVNPFVMMSDIAPAAEAE